MAKISMLVFIVLSIKEQLKSWTWLACAWLLLSCVSFSPKTENIPILSPTKGYLAWTTPNPFKNVFNPLDSVHLWSLFVLARPFLMLINPTSIPTQIQVFFLHYCFHSALREDVIFLCTAENLLTSRLVSL